MGFLSKVKEGLKERIETDRQQRRAEKQAYDDEYSKQKISFARERARIKIGEARRRAKTNIRHGGLDLGPLGRLGFDPTFSGGFFRQGSSQTTTKRKKKRSSGAATIRIKVIR